ncbi:hypothetical protein B0T16DRAFT_427144 [Cercophora newfieldiana]|uniref:TauD/TfdA-like domain-containing protein n=1 Tax=Cercophora newfieldiana TaxID=92897 RepID=A0AA39YHR0_9PEZI|nr:hypothetical protein B0T16DRAFT_427144 [Cercophora newfieldiana]
MANTHSETTPTVMESLRRHPLMWKPNASTLEYITTVSAAEDAEIGSALDSFKTHGLDGDAITKENFPLPTLQAKLDQVCEEVHHGIGFAVVRGVGKNVGTNVHTAEDALLVFLGVAAYLGDVRGVQDRQGSVITHITSAKTWTVPPNLRHGIHTNQPLQWHNDCGSEILSLHVRGVAKNGGSTFVASGWTIFSELMLVYPSVVEILQRPTWPVQISGSPPRHILMPLVTVSSGKIFFAVDPGRLGLHPAAAVAGVDSGIPELTHEQRQALDILSAFATKNRLKLDVEAGDMVFVNNFALLHARDAYVDPDSDEGQPRHLVRLWIRNSSLSWPVPESMKAPWEAAWGPKGDGNPTTTKAGRQVVIEKTYAVSPSPEYKKSKYSAGSAAWVLEDSEDVDA